MCVIGQSAYDTIVRDETKGQYGNLVPVQRDHMMRVELSLLYDQGFIFLDTLCFD
jgi:hypothetical protein